MTTLQGPVCVWNLGCELGEGPLWSPSEQALWFVDIKKSAIHRYDTRTGEGRSWTAPAPPGFLASLAGGGFVAGLKTGLHRFDPESGDFDLVCEVEPDRPGNRLNDGAVDAAGRLWFGSMDDAEAEPSGCLYRLEPGAAPEPMDEGYVITNGPAFSPDRKTVYHTDTLGRAIYAFDLYKDGTLGPRRLFATIAKDEGYPDGPVVDADGCLWTGLFGGWGLNRYAPSGELLQHVPFPCANVTKPAFGGEDYRTLYATTARKGLTAAELEDQPLAGGLFALRAPVRGLRSTEARL
jgi:sugar lactone lactonase YvrE